ncbi:MAG: GNAT family N-acetyltransferase [Actinomycetota bacterium]
MIADPDVLGRAVANCAGAYRTWAEALGKHARVWDDLSCADLELPVTLSPNNATLLVPRTTERIGSVLERVAAFFGERPGGGYELWSLWPMPDLSAAGFKEWSCPCMIRDRGGHPPPAPSELEIVEATDAATVREAEALIDDAFEIGAAPGSMLALETLGEQFRVWVGRVDGRPVTTATAYIDRGFVGVYGVGTVVEARGHGYGEAVTWAATLCRPDLPATLQASALGRGVYERMGFRTVAEFTVWERERET